MTAKTMLTLLAAASLGATPATAAPGPLCIQPGEIEDLVTFALPVLIDTAGTICAASLPPDSPLAPGAGLADRYRAEANDAWPAAKRAFGRIAGGNTASLIGDDTVRKLIADGVAARVGKGIKPESCEAIDRFASALSPLPARNVARLVVAFAQISGKAEKLPVPICAAAPPR